MNLPAELKLIVQQAPGQPVEMTDGVDRYVLIKADIYDRLMAVLDLDPPGKQENQNLMQAWGQRAGWEHPDSAPFDDLKPL